MRSLGWLNFIYICIHRLICITHKAIYRGFPEYLAQSITIQSTNRSSRKCNIMKLVKRYTSLAYSESAFSVLAQKIWNSLPYFQGVTSLSLFKLKLYVHFKSLKFVLFIIRFLFIFVFVFYYLTTHITTQYFCSQ